MWIDIVFGVVVIYGLYSGYSKGIIKTLFVALSLVVGFAAAMTLTPLVADFIRNVFGSSSTLVPVAAFLITFFGSVLLVRLLAKVLEKGLKTVRLNFVNKLGGGALLAAIGVFLFSVVVSFVDKAGLISESTKLASQSYVFLAPLAETGIEIIRQIFPFVKDMWENIIDAFKEVGTQEPTTIQ